MINMTKRDGKEVSGVIEVMVDTLADVEHLPLTCLPGSTALVLSTSDVYIFNGQGKWVKI